MSEDKNGLKLLFHQPSTVFAKAGNINSLHWQLSSRLKVCGIVSVLQITNAESAILPYIDVWPSKVKTEACTLGLWKSMVLFREGAVRKCWLVLGRYKAAQQFCFACFKWRCTSLTPFNPHTARVLLIGWCSAYCDSSLLSQRTGGKKKIIYSKRHLCTIKTDKWMIIILCQLYQHAISMLKKTIKLPRLHSMCICFPIPVTPSTSWKTDAC